MKCLRKDVRPMGGPQKWFNLVFQCLCQSRLLFLLISSRSTTNELTQKRCLACLIRKSETVVNAEANPCHWTCSLAHSLWGLFALQWQSRLAPCPHAAPHHAPSLVSNKNQRTLIRGWDINACQKKQPIPTTEHAYENTLLGHGTKWWRN